MHVLMHMCDKAYYRIKDKIKKMEKYNTVPEDDTFDYF